LEPLNGFHLQRRYIVVLYHIPTKQDAAAAKAELARREEELVAAEEVQYQGQGLMGLVPFSHCMCIFLDPELSLAFPQHDVHYCSPPLHLLDDISCLLYSRDWVLVHSASNTLLPPPLVFLRNIMPQNLSPTTPMFHGSMIDNQSAYF